MKELMPSVAAKSVVLAAAASLMLTSCGRNDQDSEKLFSCVYKATVQEDTTPYVIGQDLALQNDPVYVDLFGVEDYIRDEKFFTKKVMVLNKLANSSDLITAGTEIDLPMRCDMAATESVERY